MIAFKQKGPVNCTVVGSPTIVGGVASGFGSSPKSYLKTSSSFPNWNNISELDISIKAMVTTKNKYSYVYHMGNFSLATGGGAGIFIVYIPGQSRYDIEYSENTYYNIRVNLKDNVWSIYVDNVLKKTYELTSQITDSTSPFGFGNTYTGANSAGFQGSIDLNETYIKVNGLPWFGVCTTPVSRVCLQGPVEYTVVGSPTIQNGIVSGFSTSNYLKSGGVFDFSHPFEVNILVKDFEGTGGSQYVFGLSAGSSGTLTHSLGMYHGGQATGLSMSYGSNQYWSSLAPTLTAHVPYTINLSSDGTTVTVKVTQGNNSKTSTKALSDFAATGTCELRLGLWATYGQVFTSGSIDLNDTYIRANNKLWFGKEPVQKIVKDGVTVWEEV